MVDNSFNAREINNRHSGFHRAITVSIHGKQVEVDAGIVDLVLWMNSLAGVETYTCCQGGSECCRMDAFVGFLCANSESLSQIQNLVGASGTIKHHRENQYELSVPELGQLDRLNRFSRKAERLRELKLRLATPSGAAELAKQYEQLAGPRTAGAVQHFEIEQLPELIVELEFPSASYCKPEESTPIGTVQPISAVFGPVGVSVTPGCVVEE